MTYDNETIVRRAYHTAEGNVLDVPGFVGSFTEDGVFNDIVGQESYRGEQLGEVVLWMGKLLPDVHRELRRVTVLGDVVAVELSIQGSFWGRLRRPRGSSGRRERRSTYRPPTSGTCATARSRRSTATSGTASCSPRWA
jgi:hypothetical protein